MSDETNSSLPSVRTFVRLPSVNEFPRDPLMDWLQLLAANQKILDDKLTLLLQKLYGPGPQEERQKQDDAAANSRS